MTAEARLREQCAMWDVSDRVARTREPNALISVRDALEILGELDRLRATPSEAQATADHAIAALLEIAFQSNGFDGNPLQWPSVIAYLALGGRMVNGVQLDDEAAIRARLQLSPAADPETVARAMLAELERQARVWNGGLSDIGVDGGFDLIFLAKAAIAAVEG